MKTEKIIGIVELDEYGEFRDLLYEETNRIAQEKARKIDCEITKKIRQEAIEEFSKRILFEIEKARVIDDEDVEEYKIIEIINSLAKSYTLPIK